MIKFFFWASRWTSTNSKFSAAERRSSCRAFRWFRWYRFKRFLTIRKDCSWSQTIIHMQERLLHFKLLCKLPPSIEVNFNKVLIYSNDSRDLFHITNSKLGRGISKFFWSTSKWKGSSVPTQISVQPGIKLWNSPIYISTKKISWKSKSSIHLFVFTHIPSCSSICYSSSLLELPYVKLFVEKQSHIDGISPFPLYQARYKTGSYSSLSTTRNIFC